MSIDPVFTSFIMLMTSDLLIATLTSFNYFNRQLTGNRQASAIVTLQDLTSTAFIH